MDNFRALFKTEPGNNESIVIVVQTVALFLIIAGARFAMIWQYGTDLPYWDEWGIQGLIKNSIDGTLAAAQLFTPSNEHRILFTRLITLALALLNNQWDARVEMLVNAVICGAGAAWLFHYAAGSLNRTNRWLLFIIVALVFSLPFGWENLLTGFQSCFYLLGLFSVASIVLITNNPAFSLKWSAGCLLSVCGLFTMASGVLAPVVTLILLGVILFRERAEWKTAAKRRIPSVLACFVTAAIGFAIMVKVEGHAGYQSQDLGQFFSAFMACLSWPYTGSIWWGLFSWLPFIVLSVLYLVKKTYNDRAATLAVGMGLWLLLQYAATAFSRATIVYSVRYFDTYSYGLIVNALCVLLLLQAFRSSWKYALFVPLSLVWLYFNGTSLYALSFNGAYGGRKLMYDVEAANTGAYLVTGNYDFLIPKRDKKEIPFPLPEKYAEFLSDPVIRSMLPGSVRLPLPLQPLTGNLRQSRNGMGILDIPLHPGEAVWSAEPTTRGVTFKLSTRKSAELPYVVLYIVGAPGNIVVRDDRNRQHTVKKLPLSDVRNGNGPWQPVYARCPGAVCTISGVSGGNNPTVFSEPREMGTLSVWGLFAGSAGMKLFWAGVTLSIMIMLSEVFIWIRSRKWNNTQRNLT